MKVRKLFKFSFFKKKTLFSKHHFNLYLLKLVCIYVPKTYQAHSCNKYLMESEKNNFNFFSLGFFGTDSYFILIVGKI